MLKCCFPAPETKLVFMPESPYFSADEYRLRKSHRRNDATGFGGVDSPAAYLDFLCQYGPQDVVASRSGKPADKARDGLAARDPDFQHLLEFYRGLPARGFPDQRIL